MGSVKIGRELYENITKVAIQANEILLVNDSGRDYFLPFRSGVRYSLRISEANISKLEGSSVVYEGSVDSVKPVYTRIVCIWGTLFNMIRGDSRPIYNYTAQDTYKSKLKEIKSPENGRVLIHITGDFDSVSTDTSIIAKGVKTKELKANKTYIKGRVGLVSQYERLFISK